MKTSPLSAWSVAKSSDGFWLVEEWPPDDSVPTVRGGYFRSKTEALEYMRLSKAAASEGWPPKGTDGYCKDCRAETCRVNGCFAERP